MTHKDDRNHSILKDSVSGGAGSQRRTEGAQSRLRRIPPTAVNQKGHGDAALARVRGSGAARLRGLDACTLLRLL